MSGIKASAMYVSAVPRANNTDPPSQKLYNWVKNVAKTRKVSPVAPIPEFRRERRRTGFDAFRSSDDPARPPVVFKEVNGRRIFDIGVWNGEAKAAWASLPEETRAAFTTIARQTANTKPAVSNATDSEAARAELVIPHFVLVL